MGTVERAVQIKKALCSEKCCTFAAVISRGTLDSPGKNTGLFIFSAAIQFLMGAVFSVCFTEAPLQVLVSELNINFVFYLCCPRWSDL